MDRESAKVAKEFAEKIKKRLNIEKVILFGSRARGDNFKESDYDFILVSKTFNGKKFYQRAAQFYDFWKKPVDIELLCYTPEEFGKKKKQIGIVGKAVKEGIEI